MGMIKVPTTFNIDVEFEIPEFYRRLIALLIDILALIFYAKIAGFIYDTLAPDYNERTLDTEYNLWAVRRLIFWLPALLYHVVLEITMNGQSIGKKIMNIRVVNENGGRPSISQFLIRWMVRDIWFFFLLMIGLQNIQYQENGEGIFMLTFALLYFIAEIVLVVSSRKGQRIGDILAHTILIRTNARTSIEETVFQEVAADYTPVFPQIMRLSDKDINAIKSILETAKRRSDFQMAATASEKIKAHLKIDSAMPPFEFLEVLLKDYNYLSIK